MLKTFLWNRIKNAEKSTDSSVKHYPEDNPYEELELVGLWCFYGEVKREQFAEFLGYSALFDFFYEYSSFDFNRFDVSWLLNRFTKPILERISKDPLVREKIRGSVTASISSGKIDKLGKQNLQNILIDYFC